MSLFINHEVLPKTCWTSCLSMIWYRSVNYWDRFFDSIHLSLKCYRYTAVLAQNTYIYILILHYCKLLSGLSGKFPNYTSKSFSHLHGATGLCPIWSTPLHLLHIAPSISSSFGTIPGMLLLEYCIALPESFFNLLNRLKSSSFQYSFQLGGKKVVLNTSLQHAVHKPNNKACQFILCSHPNAIILLI